VEYQQIAAGLFFPVFSTDALWVFWNGAGGGGLVFVFGTLLGPEATGPVVGGCVACSGCVVSLCRVCVFLVSWLHVLCVSGCSSSLVAGGGWCAGVWYGVVV
jgi:hypothetical protein